MRVICKILSTEDWRRARRTGSVAPAPIDISDGYFHLSTEEQVLETARLHFGGRDDLIAARFDAEGFGAALRWEPSRGGALFPHLYADLPAAKSIGARRLMRLSSGAFEFGEDVL